jgi:hypothetical protein
MRSGMALGLVAPVDPAELAASYRAMVAGLSESRRAFYYRVLTS